MTVDQVRLVQSRYLYETTLTVEPIDRIYLNHSSTVVKSSCLHHSSTVVKSSSLYETALKDEAIDRLYVPSPRSQLALLVSDNS